MQLNHYLFVNRSKRAERSNPLGCWLGGPQAASVCPANSTVATVSQRYLRTTGVLVAAFVFLAGIVPGVASEYQLRIIAKEGDVIDGQRIVVFAPEDINVDVNNNREVAFQAGVTTGADADARWGIMTQHRFIAGNGITVDGWTPRFSDDDTLIDINNHGNVAYNAFIRDFRDNAIFIDREMIVHDGEDGSVVDGRTLTFVRDPSLNDLGEVAFRARHDSLFGSAVFTQTRVVGETGQSIDGITLGGSFFDLRVNDGGEVGFLSGIVEYDQAGLFINNESLIRPGDIIDGSPVFGVDRLHYLGDDGDYAARLRVKRNPEETEIAELVLDELIVNRNREVLFREGQLINGLPTFLFGEAASNQHGQIAFRGFQTTLDGEVVPGYHLFVDGNVVARAGQVVGDKAIERIYRQFGFNDHGDVAFRVQFNDGTGAIVLATVPEPNAFGVLIAMSGFFLYCRTRT